MDLLTIRHEDFRMYIECNKFDYVWDKAKRNLGEQELFCHYSWSEGVSSVVKYGENGNIELTNGQKAPAIFFDNVEYPIWVEFAENVKDAQFGSILQNENDKFSFRRHTLAGFLNYGNEIGKSSINLIYKIGNQTKRFSFSFEVLSSKLNYHEHWRKILEDIESEYRMLSLDYMRRTFHGFTPDQKGETPEIVWWSIFETEQKKFIQACRNILDRPRRRLHGKNTYQRADRLTFIPTNIENELAEHRFESAYLYQVKKNIHTNDTPENRFLKFALNQILDKYGTLKKRIEDIQNVSKFLKKDMDTTLNILLRLKNHPFFRTIGVFKGLSQESLVLQKASGYSQVYRTWNLLHRGYSLYDGIYRLQTKDIATLYEIWCFIEVSHIVKELLHLSDSEVEQHNRMEMNGVFTWEMGKGEHSRILFRKGDVELAELVYNPKNTNKENSSIGMQNLVVPTVPQKPDIVLQLTKNDLSKDMKFTYLFDAKYRIECKQGNVDVPPDDTINQMHRYRDAIYYRDYKDAPLKKEVIGGYILFPGDGQIENVKKAQFYKTIDEVNIGAFPLRPKDENNRKLLVSFIERLINHKSSELISKVIPQKGTFVEIGSRVLIGLVKSEDSGYIQSFLDSEAKLYYTGRNFPTTIALQDLHYFIPYIKGEGIRDVYEIIKVRTITAKEVKKSEGENANDDLRIAFELRFSRKLFANYQSINTHKFINYTFVDTTFEELDNVIIYDKI